jgi:hypothetical protein
MKIPKFFEDFVDSMNKAIEEDNFEHYNQWMCGIWTPQRMYDVYTPKHTPKGCLIELVVVIVIVMVFCVKFFFGG